MQQVLERDEVFRDRVAEGASETDLGRASWLFLHRPDGWADELGLLRAAASEEELEVSATRREHSAERRLAQVTETLSRVRCELADSRLDSTATDAALTAERTSRLELERIRGELSERAAALDGDRTRAVRSLKEAEARDVLRLDELRAARTRIAALETRVAELDTTAAESTRVRPGDWAVPVEPPVQETLVQEALVQEALVQSDTLAPPPSPWDGTDPVAVARAVQQAAAAAATLGEALELAARSLTPTVPTLSVSAPTVSTPSEGRPTTGDAGRVGAPSAEQPRGPRPPRRSPIRLRRGVHEGSPEGIEQLLATPEVVAIVDGYNVSMEAWPLLDSAAQRSSLIAMLGSLQARCGASFHVVFDGDDDGRRPSVGAPLPVRVHFSHAEVEADDVVLDMVARLPTDRPVVVVSSDRRVQDGARRLGANIVKSGELLSLNRG